jgi:5'(3')-deoxyribonucleotidase
MNGTVIGVDIDGVVADINPVWLDFYNTEYDDNLKIEDITAWNIAQFTKPACGKKMYDILAYPDFYKTVKPVQGAIEGIKRLQKAGYRLYYVSACVPGTLDQKQEWMYKYVPNYHWNQTVFIFDKFLINLDGIIDDGPHNLDQMPSYISTIRFETLYNVGVKANAHTNTWANMNETVLEALNNRQRHVKAGEFAHAK